MRIVVPESINRSLWVVLLSAGALGRIYPYLGWVLIALAVLVLVDFRYKKTFLYAVAMLACYFMLGVISSCRFGLGMPWHDFIALTLCLYVVVCFSSNEWGLFLKSLIVPLVSVLVVSVFVGFLLGYYYFDGSWLRLLGLSLNPNQIALYSLSLMCLLVAFRGNWMVLCLLFLIGLSSGSDAYLVAISVWISVALMFWVYRKSAALGVILTIAFLLAITIILLGGYVHYDIQVSERISRWLYWLRLMVDYPFAPFVGFGVGPYGPSFDSTFFGDMVLPVNPEVSGTEFHNSLLDFISSFGVLGLISVVFLFSRLPGTFRLSPAFFALIAFSSFHLSYRHPVFLLALYYAVKEFPFKRHLSRLPHIPNFTMDGGTSLGVNRGI